MSTKYRVDRVDAPRVPCGMNSILHVGGSLAVARLAFANAKPGIDTWGLDNPNFGVVLSVWNDKEGDYVVIDSKGLSH